MQIGLIGLGKMGGNMAERLAPRRSRGGRLRPQPGQPADVDSLEALAAALQHAAGGLGDGALRRADPGHHRRRWPRSWRPATSSSTAATPGTPTTRRTRPHWQPKGIRYLDVGVSGGVWGLTEGYALMVGGDADDRRGRAADLRLAQAAERRLRARRPGRRRALHQDGPQRHRVRHHAGLRRGLRAAQGRRHGAGPGRGDGVLAAGHRHPVLAAGPAGPGADRTIRGWPRSAATRRTPARVGGPSRPRSSTPCRCR